MIDRTCGDRIVLVLNMFPAARSGWGFLAMNIFVRLSNEGRFCPILTDKPEGEAFLTDYNLKSQFLKHYYNQEVLSNEMRHYHDSVEFLNCPVFHAVPGTFDARPGFMGKFNFGYITVEQPSFRDDEMLRAKDYDFIVSPSSWNTHLLRKHGIESVATVLQGIETDLFETNPMPSNVRSWYEKIEMATRGKFLVFSGGKLEFRKGQDIVIEAFKRFRSKHKDASLVTLWYNRHSNMIPVVKEDFGITKTDPESIVHFLVSKGIPRDSVDALGYVDQCVIVATLLRADVALFTNRAEGATNLLAMESLASGTPTILSNNTGHCDLMNEYNEDVAFPLTAQGEVRRRIDSYNGHQDDDILEGWGESSVDEVLEKLEYIYTHRDHARRVGSSGASFIRNRRTWEKSIRVLSDVLYGALKNAGVVIEKLDRLGGIS